MDYNFHTHTVRCGHARDTEEEYIERAIECGVKYMGFSDHIPFLFPDGHESFYRVPTAKGREYVETLRGLREKYKDKIDIKIGFETEYYPEYFSDMVKGAKEYGAEYLILGQHFYYDGMAETHHSTYSTENEADLCDYVRLVLGGMDSGLISYVAHPDVLTFVGDPVAYDREMRKICCRSRETGIPLEINFLGIRDKRFYPHNEFWKIAGEEGSPVTFGFDAHDAIYAYDGDSLPYAEELVKKYSLNYIGRPKLIMI